MSSRRPAEVFPPGQFLREEMEERGWTQAVLSEIIGRPTQVVNEIIAGKKAITTDTAVELGSAFDTGPEFWLNLEQAYKLWMLGDNKQEAISHRVRIYNYAPVSDMIKRGWIMPSDDLDVLEQRVLSFFNTNSLKVRPTLANCNLRKSNSYRDELTNVQAAWVFRGIQLAKSLSVESFSKEKAKIAVEKLTRLTHSFEEIHKVPHILAEAGIRFIIVEPLVSLKIDGACTWLDDNSPVIVMSLRYNRIDNFWFTLLHEMKHCIDGDLSIDNDSDLNTSSERPPYEIEADKFALENLVDQKALESFISSKRPLYSTRNILEFASYNNVHPGIVVGQLQKLREIKYNSFRKMLEPIRHEIIGTAVTDGWGA